MSKIEAQLSATQSVDPNGITKVFVAVHGIGSQLRYATVQAVAARLSDYCEDERRPPLGSFHPTPPFTVGLLPLEASNIPDCFKGVGLAEVFWANIPQRAVKKKDTLEETKSWAKTVVARVKALDCASGQPSNVDYEKASSVVAEIVEAIGVVEKLLFLAEKAGLLKFDLASLLEDYLGDVQIVTEFADYRGEILCEFHRVMKELTERHPGVTEVYIIAHSEGTVVSFLGLLQALAGKLTQGASWNVAKVKGFMTIGSPIDKHIVMWPELWKDLEAPGRATAKPIQWRNYYDNGDPVGFELDTARSWLNENRWKSSVDETKPGDYFDFTKEHDIGFTRYAFPGKAHNDYWEDPVVFGHFLGEVIEGKSQAKPRNRFFAGLISWVVPYFLCLGLLFGGVYLMLKAGGQSLGLGGTGKDVFVNVAALTVLLGGMTVMSRIPRLTKFVPWYLGGTAIFALSVWLYSQWISPAVAGNLGLIFDEKFGWPGEKVFLGLVAVIGVFSAFVSRVWPRTGLKPLMISSALAVAVVTYAVVTGPGANQAMWPVLLAGAGFLYLWWLAALLFDLVFVWHLYIRWGAAMTALNKIREKRRAHARSAVVNVPVASAGPVTA